LKQINKENYNLTVFRKNYNKIVKAIKKKELESHLEEISMSTVTSVPVQKSFTVDDATKVLNGQTNEVAKLAATFKCGTVGVAFFKFLGSVDFLGLFKKTTESIKTAEQLDNLPKEIVATVDRVVKLAAQENIALMHIKYGSAPRSQVQKRETQVLLNSVTNLTGKIEQLTAARAKAGLGDNSATTIQSFVEAAHQLMNKSAQAMEKREEGSAPANDIVQGLTGHYLPNRTLKAFNQEFAKQGVASITAKSLTDHIAKMTTAFSSILPPNVYFKVFKQLAAFITPAAITAHIAKHEDPTNLQAEITRRIAEATAPTTAIQAEQKTVIDTAVARINVLRGTNGGENLLDKAWLASMRADCEYVLAINQSSKKLTDQEVQTIIGALADDSKLREMEGFTGKLIKSKDFRTGGTNFDVEDPTIDEKGISALARNARAALAHSKEMREAYIKLNNEANGIAGIGKSAAEIKNSEGVVTGYDVDKDSVIGKAQAIVTEAQAKAAAAPAIAEAKATAEFTEIVGFGRKLEAALNVTRQEVAARKADPARISRDVEVSNDIRAVLV